MRKYKDTYGTHTYLRKGLKQVHIGGVVWLIGREGRLKRSKMPHQVIYTPHNNKEYHVYGEEAIALRGHMANRDGNCADEAKVKIYILTHILDHWNNWCFDLSEVPPAGKLKVIYENGTVRNIEFDGTFKPVPTGVFKHAMKPIGYRYY